MKKGVTKNQKSREIYMGWMQGIATKTYQPADNGMIASIKILYKIMMFGKFLVTFDEEGGYK